MEPFTTDDLTLAVSLCCLGHKLSQITKVGHKGSFVFTSDVRADITNYYLGGLRIEPRHFHSELRSLTSAIKRILL